jgi:hypothetical protein
MEIFHIRITWMMAFVAVAVLDFGAIWALIGFDSLEASSLLLGALPMANVLAVAILIGQRRPGSRPFFLGFEAFGAMALAFYVALTFFHITALTTYVGLLSQPWAKTIGRVPALSSDRVQSFIAAPVVVVMLLSPQVAFALIGGFLSRRFTITITPH